MATGTSAQCPEAPPPGLAASQPRGTVALIIDDIGNRRDHGMAMVELPGKLTLAILPHSPHGAALAEAGHQAGKEIMLHAPMSNTAGERPGRGALTADLDRNNFDRVLRGDIEAVPYLRGVNNHMGSELTTLPVQMGWLMQALLRRQLYFVDSRTSAETVAALTASAYSVPNLSRAVFLDNAANTGAIHGQLEKLVALAEARGVAVGIGHPYPATAAVLAEELPRLACRGIELALVSEVLERWGTIPHDGDLREAAAKKGSEPFVPKLAEREKKGSDPFLAAPLEPHLDAVGGHVGLGLGDGVLGEVEYAGGEDSVGAADSDALDEVVEVADAP